MRDVRRSFAEHFVEVAECFPDQSALECNGRVRSYRELARDAFALAATLQRTTDVGRVGLLARHSVEAYQGLLGIFLSGATYVPLTPENPPCRNVACLQQCGCTCLVVDRIGWESLVPVLHELPGATIISLDGTLARQYPQVVGIDRLAKASEWQRPAFDHDAIAYVIFTSGSSGVPKGVHITNANVAAVITTINRHIQPVASDRISQTFDLSFDGSLFNVFLAWTNGACLLPTPSRAVIDLRTVIQQSRMTVWVSTPTVATLMRRIRALQPNSFPALRHTVFAGEPLEMGLLSAWGSAAPNSIIDNLYGPTEATILCTGYRWDRKPVADPAEIAPIGTFLGEMKGRVADEGLEEVEEGEVGELLVAGPQVSPGYLGAELTSTSFVRPFETGTTYYRTGDLVRLVGGQLRYIGRLDHQVKLRGHRVELAEIEAQIKRHADCERAVVVRPRSVSGKESVVAFIEAPESSVDVARLQDDLRLSLPKYMLPRKVFVMPHFPVSVHGKVDRTALQTVAEVDASKKNGVIVLGVPRSGTTLLRRLLDGHPSLSCPGETYLLTACARFIQNDPMPNGAIAGVLPGLAQLNVDRTTVLAGLRNYFIETYAEHAVAQGKTHWGAKSAVDVFYLEQIEQLMTGHAKFVLILRHGLDVAASLVELSEKVGGYFRELHRYVSQYQYPAVAFVRMWSDLTSALLDFSERCKSQVCLIRYEDVVRDADTTINAVFRFLGISEQVGLVDRVLRERDDGLGDWKASQFTSVSTHGVGRWKQLNPPLISTLAPIANPVLLRCGYPEVLVNDANGASNDDARYVRALQLSRLVPRGTPDAS